MGRAIASPGEGATGPFGSMADALPCTTTMMSAHCSGSGASPRSAAMPPPPSTAPPSSITPCVGDASRRPMPPSVGAPCEWRLVDADGRGGDGPRSPALRADGRQAPRRGGLRAQRPDRRRIDGLPVRRAPRCPLGRVELRRPRARPVAIDDPRPSRDRAACFRLSPASGESEDRPLRRVCRTPATWHAGSPTGGVPRGRRATDSSGTTWNEASC